MKYFNPFTGNPYPVMRVVSCGVSDAYAIYGQSFRRSSLLPKLGLRLSGMKARYTESFMGNTYCARPRRKSWI